MFKCKMCGGDLELTPGSSVAICQYCGTQQTAPNADNEKKANLYNRANRLRFSNDFDKAAGVFESIVAEFPDEAEAYWGLCLCKYGIEYVDDWATGRKIPTCHRTSFDSIFSDNNFRMAMEYAYPEAQGLYHAEAKEIDRLQKAILNVAKNEPPYDVFICYKETDNNKQRTKDSVQAQDIYDALTDAGYRVFFARISLEDKLGEEYEPYIFSALMSAKVMLVIGTSFDNMNSVWVKNEWGRYLQLMKREKGRVIIPCYSDMDAYDMPQEFRNLQAQDMNKIGFIQDLVRGIGKIIVKGQVQQKSVSNELNSDRIATINRERNRKKAEEKRRRVRRNQIIATAVTITVFIGIAVTLIITKSNIRVNINDEQIADANLANEDSDNLAIESNDDMSEVKLLMDKGQYKQAHSLLAAMGREYSEEGSECSYQMGQEYFELGQYEEAAECFKNVGKNYSKLEFAQKMKNDAIYEYLKNTNRNSKNYDRDTYNEYYKALKKNEEYDMTKVDKSLCYECLVEFKERTIKSEHSFSDETIISGKVKKNAALIVTASSWYRESKDHIYHIYYPDGSYETSDWTDVYWRNGIGSVGTLRVDLEYKGEIVASESIQITN